MAGALVTSGTRPGVVTVGAASTERTEPRTAMMTEDLNNMVNEGMLLDG